METQRSTASQGAMRTWHLPALDGVRGLAIISVTIGHVLIARCSSGFAEPIAVSMGAYGVSLFFALSGFLITTLLLKEEATTGRIDIVGFYGRRFLRIFPAYFAYIACVWSLDKLKLIDHVTLRDYVASAVFARNLTGHALQTAHLWSLYLEEQFYSFWPIAMTLTVAKTRIRIVGFTLALFALRRLMVLALGWYAYGQLYERSELRLDTILRGCLLAVTGSGRMPVLRASALVASISLVVGLPMAGAGSAAQTWAAVTYPLVLLALCVLLILVIADRGWLATFLSSAPFRFVGRISYSLYLWQQLFLARGVSPLARVRRLPLNLFCAISVSIISCPFIEKPIIRGKNSPATRHAQWNGTLTNAIELASGSPK